MCDTEKGQHTQSCICQAGENRLSVDWVPTDEQTKRVTLCVALSSGNQPWDREKEALAGLGHLASLSKGDIFRTPTSFHFLFLFSKEAPGECAVRGFCCLCFLSWCVVGHPQNLSFPHMPYPVLPNLDQCKVYHAGGWREESHGHGSQLCG